MEDEEQVSFIGDEHYLDSLTVMNWIKKNKMLSFNIMKLKEGDKIRIENGFVREWNNSLQLSIGKYGRLTVL